MRGKRAETFYTGQAAGNIPAYAGKTVHVPYQAINGEEHPRVCGENAFVPAPRHQVAGTSPRMRGKQWCVMYVENESRNIPAYAGKTCISSPKIWISCGTSPRMRGKLLPRHQLNPNDRNIPAYAGKTDIMIVSAVQDAEHPRVCGENHHRWRPHLILKGTSPRMRGKR